MDGVNPSALNCGQVSSPARGQASNQVMSAQVFRFRMVVVRSGEGWPVKVWVLSPPPLCRCKFPGRSLKNQHIEWGIGDLQMSSEGCELRNHRRAREQSMARSGPAFQATEHQVRNPKSLFIRLKEKKRSTHWQGGGI